MGLGLLVRGWDGFGTPCGWGGDSYLWFSMGLGLMIGAGDGFGTLIGVGAGFATHD